MATTPCNCYSGWWLLLRHSADCQEGCYFTSCNLIDLEHVAPQALQAQTLAGGLVHLPRQDNKHHGHWVCFTRHGKSALESSYFWMDSTSGFQAMSKTDLELTLALAAAVTRKATSLVAQAPAHPQLLGDMCLKSYQPST